LCGRDKLYPKWGGRSGNRGRWGRLRRLLLFCTCRRRCAANSEVTSDPKVLKNRNLGRVVTAPRLELCAVSVSGALLLGSLMLSGCGENGNEAVSEGDAGSSYAAQYEAGIPVEASPEWLGDLPEECLTQEGDEPDVLPELG